MLSKNKPNLEINVHNNVAVTDLPCSVEVITVSKALLEQAKTLFNTDKSELCKVCIILCHTALEVEVARIESACLRKKGLTDKLIESFLYQKTNICKKSSMKLFELITGKKIADNLNLGALKKLNTMRNNIIHQGREAKKEDAKDAISVCEKMLLTLKDFS